MILCKQGLCFCFLVTQRKVWVPSAILFCLFIQVLCWFPTMPIYTILDPYPDRSSSKSLLCLWVAFSFSCPGLRDAHLSLSFHGVILPCPPDVVKKTEGEK